MTHPSTLTTLAAAAALLAACSGDNGTGTTAPQAAVTLSLATRPSSGVGAIRTGALADPLSLTDTANNTLVITSAQVVLRKIELKSSTSACTGDAEDGDDNGGNGGNGAEPGDDNGGHGAEPGDDHGGTSGSDDPAGHTIRMGALHDGDCGELKLGPVLVNLDGWFRNGSGTFVDPASGNKSQPNEGLVKSNIESSLQAFEDGDHDGSDD